MSEAAEGEDNGAQTAAILLMALGEEEAAEVLQFVEPEEVQAIGEAMNAMSPVSQGDIAKALVRFAEDVRDQSSLGIGTSEYFKKMLIRALGKEKAGSVLSQLGREGPPGIDALKWMPARSVAGVLADEHPQVIAAVFSCLPRAQAGEVVGLLPAPLRADVMGRVTKLETLHPAALRKLDEIIVERLKEAPDIEITDVGGIAAVAEILNGVSSDVEEDILSALEEFEPGLREKIQDKMFIFDNLLTADDRGLQTLLREVPTDQLVLALKGAGAPMQEKIFGNLSKNAATLLRDDLDAKGPVRLAEVEEAQKAILVMANQFAEEGKLMLGGGGDDFV